MEVGAAGDKSPGLPDALVRAAATPQLRAAISNPPGEAGGDNVVLSIQDLASPQIGELLDHLEYARVAQDPAALEGLARTAGAAVGAHDLPTAVHAITELIRLHPERAAELVRETQSLEPIRGEVNEIFKRMELGAQAHAERTLAAAASASMAIENGAGRAVRADGLTPHDILAIAQRFLDSGQHINFVRAAELGQMVLAYYPAVTMDGVPTARGRKMAGKRPRPAPQLLKILWRRAPVLVLLLGWLCLGLAAGAVLLAAGQIGQGTEAAAAIWAMGFLILVVFQFLATIRSRIW